VGPGMDHHVLVGTKQLLRKSHVLNADTLPLPPKAADE
jgi:hypothetical protein